MATRTLKIGLSATDKQNMAQDVYDRLIDTVFEDYSSSSTYKVGDYAVYNNVLYRCVTAIVTPEAWDSSKWEVATFQDLVDDVNDAVRSVNNKANVDGNYPTMTVGNADVADNLTPYSDESGTMQSKPMISQGSGTDNNTSIVTTGNFTQLREKQGNTVPVVQLSHNWNFDDTSCWKTYQGSLSAGNNIGSFLATAQYGHMRTEISNIKTGHKYIIKASVKLTTATDEVCFGFISNNIATAVMTTKQTTNWQTLIDVRDGNDNYDGLIIADFRNSGWDTIEVSDVVFFDITSWPADVIADLTAHPDHFSWYYNGSLAYNAGSLENSNGVKLVCTKRNLVNPSTFIANTALDEDGTTFSSNGVSVSDYTMIVPNKPVYLRNVITSNLRISSCFFDKDKNFIRKGNIYGTGSGAQSGYINVPANAQFIRICVPNAYVNDCDVSLYYTPEQGGDGYNQHYDFEEPTVVDTGSEQLLAFDRKLPDGTISRETTNKDLSTIVFSYDNTNLVFFSPKLTDIEVRTKDIKCDKYITDKTAINSYSMVDGSITCFGDRLYVKDTSKQGVNNITGIVQYKRNNSAKTTEQGTPFPENIDIDDYGMMYWLDENDNLVGIPQGAKIFYPINYKGFLDDMYSRVDGDSSKYALQEEVDNIKNGTTHLFEDITDSHGNKRFVEGSGTQSAIDGVTITYNKWSLSGTHLMIVLAGNIDNGTTISNAQVFSSYKLPSYILNKIIGINGNTVNMGEMGIYANDYSITKSNIRLYKLPDTMIIQIQKIGNYSSTSDVTFRIQFDLLIDDE